MMTDKIKIEETVAVATQAAKTHNNSAPLINRHDNITCYKYHGSNFDKDCQYRREVTRGRSPRMSRNHIQCHEVLGKQDGGHNVSASFTSLKVMKEALPVINVRVDGIKRTALIDPGCSRPLYQHLEQARKGRKASQKLRSS